MLQVSSAPQNIIDRLFGWWYAIAAPPAVPADAPLRERDFVRKGRFTSIILLFQIIQNAAALGVTQRIEVLIPISVTILAMLVGVILNRSGRTRFAGILILVVIEVGMCNGLLAEGFARGVSVSLLTRIPILVGPDLIAISLFSAAVALPLGVFNCVFSVLFIMLLPKTPDLVQYLSTSSYEAYLQPLSIQIGAILVSFLWSSSAALEMRRADRAEEVNKLAQALATQQQMVLYEKQQLEDSIQQIINVHMRIANGDFSARVPIDQENVLWSVAGSLNNLLARLQRWRQEAEQLRQTKQAIQQTLHDIQLAKRQRAPYLLLQRTGTVLDPLVAEISSTTTILKKK